MPININNFMGKVGWNARKYVPKLASEMYLKLQFSKRRKTQSDYIDWFFRQDIPPKPHIVNIETINRCNSTCEFCTANIYSEKRPFTMMEANLYYSIIDQLAEWDYKGHLTLYGNNEPWLDNRIVKFHKYAREKLPHCFIFMSTNGMTLDIDKVKQIQPFINQLIINNYGLEMKMHKNISEIYDYVVAHEEEFIDIDIQIQMRYLKEILTNRAGSAPNKQSNKIINESCLMPFTDMWIMPNGKLGICCCDNFEVTNFGDLYKEKLADCWNSNKYQSLRKSISKGRDKYSFCKYCDFVDAGFRMEIAKEILSGNVDAANKLGGEEKNSNRH